jgi:hypothetical protein
LLGLIVGLEDVGEKFLRNVGVTTQKIVLLMFTVVRTSKIQQQKLNINNYFFSGMILIRVSYTEASALITICINASAAKSRLKYDRRTCVVSSWLTNETSVYRIYTIRGEAYLLTYLRS